MSSLIAKDDLQLIDFVKKAWDSRDKKMASQINVALNAFVTEPKRILKKKIQAIGAGVSTDFEMLTTNAFNVTVQEDNFDLGYEKAFRVVPKDPDKDFWEIYDVENALEFRRVQEGQRIPVEGLTGDLVRASVDYYGGSLGWTDKMIRYRKVAAMVDKAMNFRNKFWTNKANNHYLLLAVAAAGNVTAYQGVQADGQLRRDIQTINRASFNLTNRNIDKGYGDMANRKLLMYANPLDRARIEAAKVATTNQTLGTGNGTVGQKLDWPIETIYTYNANIDAGSPLLVIPGQKLQRVDDMQPTTYTAPKDPLTLNELQAVWAIYGAAVADTDQLETVTLG
jgi:hypothetical protein